MLWELIVASVFFKNEDDDEEEEENDEENDGFFVPHGYLSDDEGIHDSDGEKQDENVDIRVGTLYSRLKHFLDG